MALQESHQLRPPPQVAGTQLHHLPRLVAVAQAAANESVAPEDVAGVDRSPVHVDRQTRRRDGKVGHRNRRGAFRDRDGNLLLRLESVLLE